MALLLKLKEKVIWVESSPSRVSTHSAFAWKSAQNLLRLPEINEVPRVRNEPPSTLDSHIPEAHPRASTLNSVLAVPSPPARERKIVSASKYP